MAKHERKRSKDNAKRNSGDRKVFMNEPTPAALYGKRWEDLIDAATSATEEEGSRDLTPVSAKRHTSLFLEDTHQADQHRYLLHHINRHKPLHGLQSHLVHLHLALNSNHSKLHL
jgi:hypothetical protein